jgi:hypothetical protein
MLKSILDLKASAKSLNELLGDLKASSRQDSERAGLDLAAKAKEYGLPMDDFLRFAVDLDASEEGKKFAENGLDGYEAALAYLGLPVKNDYSKKVSLAATNETFQTYPGTRVMFPQVLDNVLKWATNQDYLENVAALVGNSRTINGTEMISIVADSDEDAEGTFLISEGSDIPVRAIKTSEYAVKMHKHGSGYEVTYEFDRRAAIDIMVPYVARINRRLELSKVALATQILINGDGAHGAAPVIKQSEMVKKTGDTHVANKLVYGGLLAWLVDRAGNGAHAPIDTIAGNYDMYLQYILMFQPTLNSVSQAEALARVGGAKLDTAGIPGMFVPIKFALSSSVPAGKLIGFTKAETLEELVEAGSQISESERAIKNQKITYVKSEVTGYRLVFGDTRSIYDTTGE